MSRSNALLPDAELLEPFSSTMLSYQWPDSDGLNARLRAVILERAARSWGEAKSNAGGWHSENDLPAWPEPPVKELLRRIDAAVRELVLRTVENPREELLDGWDVEAWANLNRRGHYNRSHDHTQNGNLWSGIYYVDPGAEGGSVEAAGGLTWFEDGAGVPVVKGADGTPAVRELSIQPRAGLMVLFPGRLRHRVDPYLGDRERITVAFNLRHPGFVVPSPTIVGLGEGDWMWKNFRGVMLAAQMGRRAIRQVLRR